MMPKGVTEPGSVDLGPLDDGFNQLRQWDSGWAGTCAAMITNPWRTGVLSLKLKELISVGLNAACTNLNSEGTRRHIRKALDAGATTDQILLVLKCAMMVSIHSCSLGAPILLEEAKAAGVKQQAKPDVVTPACDRMKVMGQWNTAWDPFYEIDPVWTEEIMATGIGVYSSDALSAKEIELLSVALDASYTHMYGPGTRRHIHNALRAGATIDEIMEVLKLCVAQGVQACNLGVATLAQELMRRSANED